MAAALLAVCKQALTNDTLYQQAISQALAAKENLPINVASLLPNIDLSANPSITRTAYAGSNVGLLAFSPRNNTARAYTLTLSATQTVFNAAQYEAVAGAASQAKGADATINAALQNLMIRASAAYFAVLEDEDKLSYSEASKAAYSEQLSQITEQFKVGLKTITDVYTARASYAAALANTIASQTRLANDRENLRVITGEYYPQLASLSENFPLITPQPANMETWVKTAQLQNWSIKAQQYAVDTSAQQVKQQFAGHLPTVSIQGSLDRMYANNINGYPNLSNERNGPSTETNRAITLNVNMPIFTGGSVVAQTNQAAYNYRASQQLLEQIVRQTINTTRQSYLNLASGISQIKADKEAVKSAISALLGMEASYKVGTETLVNVLNQQQKVYQSQTDYASDRYAFVNNILNLKQAAGTLNFNDLRALNAWLQNDARDKATKKIKKYAVASSK